MKFLVLLFSLFFSFTAFAEQTKDSIYINQFKNQLNMCDVQYKKQLTPQTDQQIITTNDQITAVDEATDCYKKIASNIFDVFYPHTKEKMNQSLNNLIKLQYDFYENIYQSSKYCQSNCGSIYVVISHTNVKNDVLNYISETLNFIEMQNK